MALIGVREAAARLSVSPRRVLQRIADGTLPAVRVGNQWAIEEARVPLGLPQPSRPLSRRTAWALLATLAGETPGGSATERARLATYAQRLRDADDPAVLLRAWMARRAERHELRAAAGDLDDLRDDDRLRLAGVSAPNSFVVGRLVQAYVTADDVDDLVEDYLLVPAPRQDGNVLLHVAAPLPDTTRWAVLATDLAEHLGSRESARVAELVRHESADTSGGPV